MTQKYRCGNCNYKFVPKAERAPSRCPYCGKDKLLVEEGVNEMLKDPELDSYDW
ncbi:hypothetical protein ACFL96_07940 [Thermoproteota archaeon]